MFKGISMRLRKYLGVFILCISCSISAEEQRWDWTSIELASLSSIAGKGYARHYKLAESFNFELFSAEGKRILLLLCQSESSNVTCVDNGKNEYSGFIQKYKASPSLIDLDTGLLFGSINTYVLFTGKKMITISYYHTNKHNKENSHG
jgi:hypothetical protein